MFVEWVLGIIMLIAVFSIYRQYMNRRGGFNRPLDFIAWATLNIQEYIGKCVYCIFMVFLLEETVASNREVSEMIFVLKLTGFAMRERIHLGSSGVKGSSVLEGLILQTSIPLKVHELITENYFCFN